jgi:thiol:disulfide interchange protein DsbD
LVILALVFSGAANAQTKYATVSAVLNKSALQAGSDAVVAVVVDVAEGFHAQSHTPHEENLIPCEVRMEDMAGVEFSKPVYPAGKDETYPALGVVSVYSGRVVMYVPVKVKADAKAGDIKLSGVVRYQACNDKMCFAPQKAPFVLETKIVGAGEAVAAANSNLFPTGALIASDDAQWSILTALGVAFFAGILFNVMPCVLPVLPLKAVGFYEISQHHRGKTLMLAGVFSAGIVSVFTVLAVLILVTKNLTWGQQFSNPIFAWGIVILMTVMAMAMFGAFTILLPTKIYSITPKHDTYTGNFLFGILTAVLSTPCTAPLFPPLLLWAKAQPVGVGVPAVMMVGVGMAFPYLLLSAFPEAARKFPRVGPWAELVKQMMGFLLLGAAVFFASGQLIAGPAFWWPIVGVAAIGSLYLVGRTIQLSKNALPLGISSTLAVGTVGAMVAIAIWMNTGIAWTEYSEKGLKEARDGGRIVLVDFTANWCLNCHTIEGTVFHDRAAISALQDRNVLTMQADLTKTDAPGWDLLTQLNPTGGIPLTAIYAPGASEPIQISSVYTTKTLLEALEQATGKSVAEAR